MDNTQEKRPMKWLKNRRLSYTMNLPPGAKTEKREPEYIYGFWHRWFTSRDDDGNETVHAIVEREADGQVIRMEAENVIFVSNEEDIERRVSRSVSRRFANEAQDEDARRAIDSL